MSGTPFGKFEMLEQIGHGGMATVHRALLRGIGGFEREVVLKRILPEMAQDEHFVKMFVAEAKLSAQLEHPNIVQIYDFGRVDNSYFIAMEYLDGVTALNFIKYHGKSRPVPQEAAAFIMYQVLLGLDYAHRLAKDGRGLGLVHRDVSPANVILTKHGGVKILDFGIAKAVEAIEREDTRTGTLKGKWSYMSPEQVEGRRVTARSDIFSAGIILWEMLTCRRLFKAKTDFLTLANVVRARVPPVTSFRPDLSPDLDRICGRALARMPEDRYETADAMAEDLERLLAERHFGTAQLTEYVQEIRADEGTKTTEIPMDIESHTGSISESAVGFRLAEDTDGSLVYGQQAFSAEVSRRGLTLTVLVGIGVVAAVGVIVGLVMLMSGSEDGPAPAVSVSTAPVVEKVKVEVATNPEGARVHVGSPERYRGLTPLTIEYAKGNDSVPLRIELTGHRQIVTQIRVDRNQQLVFGLSKRSGSAKREASGSKQKVPARSVLTGRAKPHPKAAKAVRGRGKGATASPRKRVSGAKVVRSTVPRKKVEALPPRPSGSKKKKDPVPDLLGGGLADPYKSE